MSKMNQNKINSYPKKSNSDHSPNLLTLRM